jgi:nucleoside-diphosphate-sugar epimerase
MHSSSSNKKTISILGSGWLGLPLAKHFVDQGYRVKASTRSVDRMPEIEAVGAKPYIVDIDQDTSFSDFFGSELLIVNITSKNIDAFKRLVKEAERSLTSNVLFVSSTSVYQNTNKMVSENDGAENLQSSLYQIENLFQNNTQFETTVIRFAGLFGYSRHPGRFFAERPIPQPDTPVNLIHRDDCINIIDRIVEQEKWNEVFNACADTHPSKGEFYSHAREMMGMPAPVMADSGQAGFKMISNEKVKQALNYAFIHADLMAWSGL